MFQTTNQRLSALSETLGENWVKCWVKTHKT